MEEPHSGLGQPGREGSGAAGRPLPLDGMGCGEGLCGLVKGATLALLLFVIHFSRPYPFEKTLSGLGLEGFSGRSAFFACY